jgi:hypothetical protein
MACDVRTAAVFHARRATRATPDTHATQQEAERKAVELRQRRKDHIRAVLMAQNFLEGVTACVCVWCGVVWCGVVWCGVVWCGVVWCGVVWCGVVWCGVVWCGMVWRLHACAYVCVCRAARRLLPWRCFVPAVIVNNPRVNCCRRQRPAGGPQSCADCAVHGKVRHRPLRPAGGAWLRVSDRALCVCVWGGGGEGVLGGVKNAQPITA